MRVGDVVAMAALVVTILCTLIVAGQLQTVANTFNLGSQGNQTRITLFNNTFQGLTLASLGIIVAAAVGLISLILSAIGGRREG